jgi:hypothetical protein
MVRIRNKRISVPRFDRKEKHYSIEEVLSQTIFDTKRNGKAYKVDFDGEWINMASDRYQCFAVYGTTCVDCGLEAQYFIMERQGHYGQYHFNLYGLDDQGNEVLFTKDHILPRSRGGKDELKNYQPMCTNCNNKKGSDLIYPVNTWLIPAYA